MNVSYKFVTMQKKEGIVYGWGKNMDRFKQICHSVVEVGVGENHIVMVLESGEVLGFGSNKFGQLGLAELITFEKPERILKGINVKSVHCGAEHTFIVTEKHEVFSMGLNIKGQLGLGTFENTHKVSLVTSLLPYGRKNPKSLSPNITKAPKPQIVQILERFELQVKVEQQSIETMLLLHHDEFIFSISCGALFTLALTNKGRVFGCGYQGTNISTTHEEYFEKSKFKLINFDGRIIQLSCGLSGAAVINSEGFAYVWGRFGKTLINAPKKVVKNGELKLKQEEERYAEVAVGDQFVAVLTVKGEIWTFGENIDGQLGNESVVHRSEIERVEALPLVKKIYVGRNHCIAIGGDDTMYGWGSNRYGQIAPIQSLSMTVQPCSLNATLPTSSKLYLSSYFTLILSPIPFSFPASSSRKIISEQTIPLSEYKKLLHDYQVLKSLNLALLEKNQPPKKQHKEVQTFSKFEIDGVTKFRQFNTNVEIDWSELQLIEKINQGGYGVIYKAKWREIVVVVKKFKIENGDVSLRDFLSECNAMEAVRHPSIVMFLGAVTKPKHYSIILEYCSKGSLWSYLQNLENQITWEERKRLAIQIAQGVLYLHQCNPPILHRDLKSLNIFLDQHYRIKIGDFGWTKTLEQYMTNKIGTYQWMAPEVIGNMPYSQKADVFSYSIILWEIASREPPYRNITGTKVSEAVLNYELRPQIPKKTPEPFSKLMKKCWQTDPNRRPTFRQIIRELEIMKL